MVDGTGMEEDKDEWVELPETRVRNGDISMKVCLVGGLAKVSMLEFLWT